MSKVYRMKMSGLSDSERVRLSAEAMAQLAKTIGVQKATIATEEQAGWTPFSEAAVSVQRAAANVAGQNTDEPRQYDRGLADAFLRTFRNART